MDSYKIFRLDDQSKYECLFITTSYQDPFEDIHLIESTLKESKIKGYALFDLLSQIGDNSERFMEAYFNGEVFEINSFQFLEVPKNSIYRTLTIDFFQKNSFILDETILTSIQKKMIANGITI
ncbi:type II toxin-antitoxin system RnlB family antitoxin [Evansella clarkii]|uniref:type II toxin-antitoxin system RnlB family antitoxin n=1 Tax=Evansella clarkii TaxID=79879 RepID=UPI000996F4B2|nr:type II toxin-antitoxin system RnlB family antitoxin [Evansella clarkii]